METTINILYSYLSHAYFQNFVLICIKETAPNIEVFTCGKKVKEEFGKKNVENRETRRIKKVTNERDHEDVLFIHNELGSGESTETPRNKFVPYKSKTSQDLNPSLFTSLPLHIYRK